MKKRFLFPLILILVIALLGCQEKSNEEIKTQATTSTSITTQSTTSTTTTSTTTSTTLPPTTTTLSKEKLNCGKFIDSYTRLQGGAQDFGRDTEGERAKLLTERMKENEIGCAVLISVDVQNFDSDDRINENIDYYYNILKKYPQTFFPLLDIDSDSASDINVDLIKKILQLAKGKIDYWGYGEVSFVDPGPWKSKKLTDEPWPEVFSFLGKNNLIFAAHIKSSQKQELSTMLDKYPKVKVLVHANPSGMAEILKKHKNLYYVAELEVMLKGEDGFGCSISFNDAKVDSSVNEYLPIIEAAPNQVLWATNAASTCHFKPEFYNKLIEFTNKFIEKLPEEYRDKFAYENAERLINMSNK